MLRFLAVGLFACGIGSLVSAQDSFPKFTAQVLDPDIGKVCYAVTLADVDGDGSQDIVAVTENRVLWFAAPHWTPHVLIEDQVPLDHVCISPMDVDGDGQVDFALGAGWTRNGSIHWLRRKDDLDQKWDVFLIAEERWVHRMRWADVLGTGKPQLVVSPLNASRGPGVMLTAFSIPDDPTTDRWPATVLNQQLNRLHNHWHYDLNDDGLIDTLTASQEGVNFIHKVGDDFQADKLAPGAQADTPELSGAGEIKTGHLADGTLYICTVEPMHGTMLAVYRQSPSTSAGGWARELVDDGFQRGHALWTADVDGDGDDEIVFGHSDTPEVYGVRIYDPQTSALNSGEALRWNMHVIDAGGIATEDLIVGDVTGDGKPDIVAGGRATHNLKLFVQE